MGGVAKCPTVSLVSCNLSVGCIDLAGKDRIVKIESGYHDNPSNVERLVEFYTKLGSRCRARYRKTVLLCYWIVVVYAYGFMSQRI